MRHPQCECGRPKSARSVEACGHCRFLDGTYSGERTVIAILRTIGTRLTASEVAALAGLSYHGAFGILRRLVRDGRAIRLSGSEMIEAKGSPSGLLTVSRITYELVSRRPALARAAKRARKRRAASKVTKAERHA